jgi:hypothetical protein
MARGFDERNMDVITLLLFSIYVQLQGEIPQRNRNQCPGNQADGSKAAPRRNKVSNLNGSPFMDGERYWLENPFG